MPSLTLFSGKNTTPLPVRSSSGPGVGPSNSNDPLASSRKSAPKSDAVLAGVKTMLASANKQIETATKAIEKLERTESVRAEILAKVEKEASTARENSQRWKAMYEEQQREHEKLQAKYETLKTKYGKLKGEVSNLKLPQVEMDSDSN
ncbi:hypothetical protein G6514_006581 [Epicoccum nigrum]|nr:hypothetical protein G6514_006581 [Epicoccum nigrum]